MVKLKKILLLIVVLTMTIINISTTSESGVTVRLDGEILKFDVQPQIIDGRTMVPMRAIFEAMGATVTWEADNQRIVAVKDATTINMYINNKTIIINDKHVILDVEPQIINGRTLVPVRAVADSLNSSVDWDTTTSTVKIITSTVNGNLQVSFIDVGQADSILIKSNDASMVIDAGNNADGGAVVSYLKQQGITKLDYVIGTHPHEDHIGGMDDVIRTFNVGTIIMPKASNTTITFEDVLEAISVKGLKVTTPVPGTTYSLGEATFTVLAPNSTSYNDLNDNSVVIKLTHGKSSFLFEGDAEAVSESEMISKGYDLKADVLKVGHHGSTSSTTQAFLDLVKPTYAVISVGEGNSYGHPAQSTISRLNNSGVQIFRTDELGTIIATSDGNTIKFDKIASPVQPNAPPVVRNNDNTSTAEKYIGNINSKKVHRPTCKSLPYEENRVYFDKREAAISAGYVPCKLCNP